MAVLLFLVYFYMFWSWEKNEIWHQECTEICHFDPKIPPKKIYGEASPDSSPVRRGCPLPTPHFLGAFGASTRLAPSALDLGLPNFNSWIRLWLIAS